MKEGWRLEMDRKKKKKKKKTQRKSFVIKKLNTCNTVFH